MIPIHLSDLLQRRERLLDTRPVRAWLSSRRVAITGGGGFIGSELARLVASYEPASLRLIDNNETALYNVCRAIPSAEGKFGDVRDYARMMSLLNDRDVVFHAAAMKHVPICQENVAESGATNRRGTFNVFQSTGDDCRVVLVSTDKAVNPTTWMGRHKAQAEEIACKSGRAAIVRFGNVIGSTGSVVPLFMEQIAAGGPVTVTDPAMTRYFMTVGEAAELILQAGAAGAGCYVLDMGKPVSIDALAREMIRLSGRRDVDIVYTGVRAGEKLHETLSSEPLVPSGIDGIWRTA